MAQPKAARGAMGLLALSPVGGYQQYHILRDSVAHFPHYEAPFTQGLSHAQHCSVAKLLDGCYATQKDTSRASCYERVLSQCIDLYECTGLHRQSEIRLVKDYAHGKPLGSVQLPASVFGEGCDLYPNKREGVQTLIVGTWRNQLLFEVEHDLTTHKVSVTGKLKMPNHSSIWGIATDLLSQRLWLTTGTAEIFEYTIPLQTTPTSPADTAPAINQRYARRLIVTCEGRPLREINELTFDSESGTLWANLWMTDTLYQIDPATGVCLGALSLAELPPLAALVSRRQSQDPNAVWNGTTMLGGRWMLFTGKRFDQIFLARYT